MGPSSERSSMDRKRKADMAMGCLFLDPLGEGGGRAVCTYVCTYVRRAGREELVGRGATSQGEEEPRGEEGRGEEGGGEEGKGDEGKIRTQIAEGQVQGARNSSCETLPVGDEARRQATRSVGDVAQGRRALPACSRTRNVCARAFGRAL